MHTAKPWSAFFLNTMQYSHLLLKRSTTSTEDYPAHRGLLHPRLLKLCHRHSKLPLLHNQDAHSDTQERTIITAWKLVLWLTTDMISAVWYRGSEKYMYIHNIIPLMIYMWRCRHVPDLCTNKHSLSAAFSLAQPRWAESRHPGWKPTTDRPKHIRECTNSTQVLHASRGLVQLVCIWLAIWNNPRNRLFPYGHHHWATGKLIRTLNRKTIQCKALHRANNSQCPPPPTNWSGTGRSYHIFHSWLIFLFYIQDLESFSIGTVEKPYRSYENKNKGQTGNLFRTHLKSSVRTCLWMLQHSSSSCPVTKSIHHDLQQVNITSMGIQVHSSKTSYKSKINRKRQAHTAW